MKKAIIITVYNSENCGSFLQAYAMMKTLVDLGYEVAFLKRDIIGTSHDLKKRINDVIKQVIHLHLTEAYFNAKRWLDFNFVQKQLPVCEKGDTFYNAAELVVLGSDTIWNFDDSYFSKHIVRYLGIGISGKRIISYATSIGNTTIDTFHESIKQNGNLDNIHDILVRDKNTKNAVETLTNRQAEIVCDPTLLTHSEIFAPLTFHLREHNYLLLYYFDEPSEDLKNEIISLAREEKIKIISLITKRDWCDIFVPSSPQAMVSYYINAKYIVTNTFHGCALSLLYGKRFAVHDEGKVKVLELMEIYNQSKHIFSDAKDLKCKLCEEAPAKEKDIRKIADRSINSLKKSIS